MEITIIDIALACLQFFSVSFLIWAMFRTPLVPEPPVNRRIAIALGLHDRQTVFETPVLKQLLNMALMMAKRFPFFRDRIRTDLEASGNPSGYSVEEYLALCLSSAAGVLLMGLLVAEQLFAQFALPVMLFMPLVGFYIPLISLRDSARRRMASIAKNLPYSLDLIALMMEAGGTFTESIQTLIRDDPTDNMNQELQLVLSEIEFGTPRAAALANMAHRIPLDALSSVVGAINQAEQLGTPLSTILKNQSVMLRNTRSVRAEEASAKASLRILVPSMLIMLAVVLIVFSPLILYWLSGSGASSLNQF